MLERVCSLCLERPRPAGIGTPEEAFRGLLRGRGLYGFETAYTDLAVYKRSAVSLPESVAKAPMLKALLPAEMSRVLCDYEERMLRPRCERLAEGEAERRPKVHSDRPLLTSRRLYSGFVRRLKQLHRVDFTLTPEEEVGVFFVYKKGREKMRMILDCRRSNTHFLSPPGVDLLSSEGLSRIEVHDPAGVEIALAMADVKDCFHRMRLDGEIRRWFCYPPGTAKEFGLVGRVIEGEVLTCHTRLWPCAAALPMGWTWPLALAESANLGLLESVPRLMGSQRAFDRGHPMVFGGSEAQRWHYVCVDNLGLLSTEEGRSQKDMAAAREAFESQRLLLHDSESGRGTFDVLGSSLDCARQRTRVGEQRYWKVRDSLRHALRLGQLSGQEVEVLIGHCTLVG